MFLRPLYSFSIHCMIFRGDLSSQQETFILLVSIVDQLKTLQDSQKMIKSLYPLLWSSLKLLLQRSSFRCFLVLFSISPLKLSMNLTRFCVQPRSISSKATPCLLLIVKLFLEVLVSPLKADLRWPQTLENLRSRAFLYYLHLQDSTVEAISAFRSTFSYIQDFYLIEL